MALVVTAPLVLVKVAGGGIQYCYAGSFLPENADQEAVKHLQAVGMVKSVSDDGDPGVVASIPAPLDGEEGADPGEDGGKSTEQETPTVVSSYAEMDYPALQEAAKQHGLPANQTKDALVAALQDLDAVK